jgi:hypothetical protein
VLAIPGHARAREIVPGEARIGGQQLARQTGV